MCVQSRKVNDDYINFNIGFFTSILFILENSKTKEAQQSARTHTGQEKKQRKKMPHTQHIVRIDNGCYVLKRNKRNWKIGLLLFCVFGRVSVRVVIVLIRPVSVSSIVHFCWKSKNCSVSSELAIKEHKTQNTKLIDCKLSVVPERCQCCCFFFSCMWWVGLTLSFASCVCSSHISYFCLISICLSLLLSDCIAAQLGFVLLVEILVPVCSFNFVVFFVLLFISKFYFLNKSSFIFNLLLCGYKLFWFFFQRLLLWFFWVYVIFFYVFYC